MDLAATAAGIPAHRLRRYACGRRICSRVWLPFSRSPREDDSSIARSESVRDQEYPSRALARDQAGYTQRMRHNE
jgi:hypothetical protein